MLHFRYDLLKSHWIKKALKSRLFLFSLRLLFVLLFLLIIYAGLVGSIYRNIATVLTGIIWLTAITLAVLLLGKVWCLVCPWNTIAEWFQRYTSLNLKWPGWLRNIYLAIFLLVSLVFIEYAFGITTNPRMVAYIALFILTLTISAAVIFKGKSFCRYGCSVGVISGLYALFAPLELRRADQEKCHTCRTKDCVKGNAQGAPCPVFEYPGQMAVNTYCILCLECLKTCPKDNLSLNLRPLGTDLARTGARPILEGGFRKRSDEAFLVILLLVLTTFHTFYSSSAGAALNEVIQIKLGQTWTVAILVLAVFLLSVLIFYLIGRRRIYAYTILPFALATHLSLVIQRLSLQGHKILPAFSDPFGWNWNLLGVSPVEPLPIFPSKLIWYGEIGLVGLGLLYTLYFTAQSTRAKARPSTRSYLTTNIPLFLILFAWSVLFIWLTGGFLGVI